MPKTYLPAQYSRIRRLLLIAVIHKLTLTMTDWLTELIDYEFNPCTFGTAS